MSAENRDNVDDGDVERLRAERDALEAQVATLRQRKRRTGVLRRVAVVVLVVLACVSVTATTVAVWANRTVLTTDGWVETVGPLGADPAVTAALRPRVTEAVFSAVPAEQLIADALPQDVAFLAVPLSTAVRDFVDEQVGAFLASDAFADLWVESNRVAHEQALGVLRGESDVVRAEGETVTLNLLPVVNAVLAQVANVASGLLGENVTLPTVTSGELPEVARAEINAALGVELPEDVGQIPVYDADELLAAQQALRLFDQIFLLLLIATPVLIAGAIWLSRNRRATIVQLSVGSVLLLVLVRRVLLRVQEDVVALPPLPAGRTAVQAVTDQLFGGLFDLAGVLIAIGLAIAAVAYVTGPYRSAVALRRGVVQAGRAVSDAGGRLAEGTDTSGAVQWIGEHGRALQVGGALFVVALLLLFEVSWGWFLALIVLLAAWEAVLWRIGAPDSEGLAESA